MADTNVRIKLTADGKQVQQQLKLIDEEAKRIGKNAGSASSRRSSQKSELGDDTKTTESGSRDANSERHEKLLRNLYNELRFIRKEMQKSGQGIGSGGGMPTGSGDGGTTSGIPSGGSSGGKGGGSQGGLGNILGKLVSLAAIGGGLNKAKNYVFQGAKSSATGESLAYQTYGSTLAYQDYYDAKKSAYSIGRQYGYDYSTVMQGSTTNMESGAGWTTRDNYAKDMDSILRTSKAWGIDTSLMASTSGRASAMGITESGNQSAYTKIIANAIVDSGMVGREEEMVNAIGSLQENLGSKATTVSEESLKGSLGLYNTLVNQNENLKGERGSSLVQTMQNMATSDNSSLMILAGLNQGEYNGLAGRQALREMAENDPAQFWQRVAQGAQQNGIATPQLKELIYQFTGSQSQANEIVNALPEIASGNYKFSSNSGENETNARLENYNDAKVSSQEQYDIEKADAQETAGNAVNTATGPLKDLYNGLPDWARVGVDAVGGVAEMGAYMLGGKLLGKAGGKIFKGTKIGDLFSKGGTAGTAAAAGEAGAATAAAKGAGGIGEILSGLGTKASGALKGASEGLGGIGEALGGGLKGLGTAGKGLLKKIPVVGTLLGLGMTAADVGSNLEEGDERGAAEAAGGGIGGILGGIGAGAAAGAAIGSVVPGAGTAIGGLIGGIIGAFGGEAAGSAIGGAIYDSVNSQDYWDAQAYENQQMYNELNSPTTEENEDNTKATENLTESIDDLNDTLTEGTNLGAGVGSQINQTMSLVPSQSSFATSSAGSSSSTEGTASSGGGILDAIGGFFGGIGSAIGNFFTGHAVGNDYVPRDNYLASLHKGEMVLNKFDADDYRQGKVGQNGAAQTSSLNLNVTLSGGISGMTSENQNQIVQAVVQQIKGTDLQAMLSNGFSRVPNY